MKKILLFAALMIQVPVTAKATDDVIGLDIRFESTTPAQKCDDMWEFLKVFNYPNYGSLIHFKSKDTSGGSVGCSGYKIVYGRQADIEGYRAEITQNQLGYKLSAAIVRASEIVKMNFKTDFPDLVYQSTFPVKFATMTEFFDFVEDYHHSAKTTASLSDFFRRRFDALDFAQKLDDLFASGACLAYGLLIFDWNANRQGERSHLAQFAEHSGKVCPERSLQE
jgi:hypothetical protein